MMFYRIVVRKKGSCSQKMPAAALRSPVLTYFTCADEL